MTDKEKLLAEIDKCLTETSRLQESGIVLFQ